MTVYLDSSFVIRRLLGIGRPAEFWGKWDKAYASTLMRTECCRAANRLRLDGKLDDAGRARPGTWIATVCRSVTQIPVTDSVMRRAAEAYPVDVGTLQAIHLATVLELESVHGVKCALASEDEGLVQAARALGIAVASDGQQPARGSGEGATADAAAGKPSGAEKNGGE